MPRFYNKSEPACDLNRILNKPIPNQFSFKRQQSKSKEEIIGPSSLLDPIHNIEV